MADALADDYRLVFYDKRGHGLSEATPAPYALTDHVGDLTALLDHLGIKSATIVGLSVGGMIAQGLAALRPDLVERLVLSDTAHKIGSDELWNARIDAVTNGGIASISDQILERWFTPAYRDPGNADFVGYSAMLERTTVDGYAGTHGSITVDCPHVVRADLSLTRQLLGHLIGNAVHHPRPGAHRRPQRQQTMIRIGQRPAPPDGGEPGGALLRQDHVATVARRGAMFT